MDELQIPQSKSVNWRWLISLLAVVLQPVFKILSKEIRDLISDNIGKWYAKARLTDNPWDDFVVEFLAAILKIDLPE